MGGKTSLALFLTQRRKSQSFSFLLLWPCEVHMISTIRIFQRQLVLEVLGILSSKV